MSRSKQKPPKIDLRLLTRSRLNALFDRHARGEVDMEGLETGVQALMVEVGHRPVLDALIKRMENAPDAERETLMELIPRLRSREVIEYLWQQVKKPGALALDVKMTGLTLLKEMGEDVDLTDPGRYFSPREIKPSDMKSIHNLLRLGLRGLARSLREARDPAEVEACMLRINQMSEEAIDGDAILLELVANAEAEANDLGADFLQALAHTTPFPRVLQAAERALARLAAAGIKPVTPALLRLGQDRFYAAYMTDPEHPWQQSVTVAWERAGGVIQALVFLLDFGFPWRGAIKDMFATQGLTPQRFQQDLIERSEMRMGLRLYRVNLARAQATIAAAVQANQQYNIPLPKEFCEVRHLVERWVLHPPAALAADLTRDELAGRPLVPNRSTQPLLMDMRDLEHDETFTPWVESQLEEGEKKEAFNDLTEVLDDVEATFEELEYNVAWMKPEWIRDYLTSITGEPRGTHLALAKWIRDRLATLSSKPECVKEGDERLKLIVEHWRALRDSRTFSNTWTTAPMKSTRRPTSGAFTSWSIYQKVPARWMRTRACPW